jgi:hypothetical protein
LPPFRTMTFQSRTGSSPWVPLLTAYFQYCEPSSNLGLESNPFAGTASAGAVVASTPWRVAVAVAVALLTGGTADSIYVSSHAKLQVEVAAVLRKPVRSASILENSCRE